MLLPESTSASRDKPLSLVYRWGHPFEHELFDAPKPEHLLVRTPDGKQADLTKQFERVTVPGAEGKQVTAYRLSYTPLQRGDHVFLLTTPPVWMKSEQEFWQDSIKVVVHVLTQNGWDAAVGEGFELVPLTRPYGLRAGMVFQAQALLGGKPVPGVMAEVERYNQTPPKELPPDEHITRRVKADPNGVLTCTLTDPGWWCVTVSREAGQRQHDGKNYPLRQRATFWVHVDAG
jgi:cobalt/nickel transport protein